MPLFAQIIAVLVAMWGWLWPIACTLGSIGLGIWGLIKAWPQIRRIFTVSDTVGTLPELIKDLRKDIADVKSQTQSLEEKSDKKDEKLEAIQGDVIRLVERYDAHLEDNKVIIDEWVGWRAKQDTMYGELTHNGGSSLKDSVSRMELAFNGYAQLPGETLQAAVLRMRNVLSASTAPVPLPPQTS